MEHQAVAQCEASDHYSSGRDMLKENHIGAIFVLFAVGLVSCMALSGVLQFTTWPVVLYLIKFTFVVLLVGTVGGVTWESFVGRGKGTGSNLLGGALIVALLGWSFILFYRLTEIAPEAMNTLEKTVETAALMMGSGGAATLGRYAVRRIPLDFGQNSFCTLTTCRTCGIVGSCQHPMPLPD
jgi:hypothetical protein